MRGAVASTKLILDSQHNDPTHAESIKTAQVTDISLHFPLQLLEHIADGRQWPQEPTRKIVDKRNPMHKQLADCPPWTVYGGRGQRPEIHMLSAYEFAKHYHIKPARHPYSEEVQLRQAEDDSIDQKYYHAVLTDIGIAKCNRNKEKSTKKERAKLVPGTDYRICEEGGADWLPLGKGNSVAMYRHDWIIAQRRRPYVPVLYGAQGAKSEEEQAMRILVAFFPWVNHAEDATPQAPFINDLWQPGMQTWRDALLSHASCVGFPTVEVKRMVMSYGFTYCLPREMRLKDGLQENSDNVRLEGRAGALGPGRKRAAGGHADPCARQSRGRSRWR